ncbi:Protein of unknown function DUF789 [Dillenia turbinata]|uniref:Uncharacterized protein n=1 Tax=Dillenia turbinata TaxID=194707 RepID=A0AAN8ZGZ3_9MAGN
MQAGVKGKRKEGDMSGAYFTLGDLWKSFEEWSAYGAGVPLVLKEGDPPVTQYYIPFLSGIQLYIDPSKSSSGLRNSYEESGAEPSTATGSAESSGCEPDRRLQGVAAGEWSTPLNLNAQMTRLSLRNEAEKSNSPGMLIYEYLENGSPWSRPPLFDKVSALASEVPELNTYKSSDVLPASWLCVAWYPIYRIPLGQTLKELEASFLTFHHLSTQSKSIHHPKLHASSSNGWKVEAANTESPKISLTVFGLASYKFIGSMLTPTRPQDRHQEISLLQAAANFLNSIGVELNDFKFFSLRSSEDDLQQPSDVNIPNKNKH